MLQKIISSSNGGNSLGLRIELKFQYFGHLIEELTHLKRPWCWERLRAGGEGDNRGWDGWMASPTLWTWVWVDSRSWWWTGRPGVLWFMGSQRVRHDWVSELNWRIELGGNCRQWVHYKNPKIIWERSTVRSALLIIWCQSQVALPCRIWFCWL